MSWYTTRVKQEKAAPIFAYVDVETTGSSPTYDRVIELAIIKTQNGRILETLNTVLDPETHVPPSIHVLTGISEAEIERAPTFVSLANRAAEMLQGAVFVAHNARFDYAFIKNEFDRAGIAFQAKCLCTVKLSRKLFLKYKKHDLSSIIERFDFRCENRHRAMSDAEVLVDFIKLCEKKFGLEKCEEAYRVIMKRNALPVGLTHAHIDALPETAGVYLFYGADGDILYIGKSINIRGRVLSHFADDHRSGKEMRMSQEIADIETITTSGELSALLLESHLIKQKQPVYNRLSRYSKELTILKENFNEAGYIEAKLERTSDFKSLVPDTILGIFRSQMQAKKILNEYAKEQGLCPVLLGLEKSQKNPTDNARGCFFSQIGICKGACIGKESPESYNARVHSAFSARRVKTWPFKGAVMITEKKNEHEGTLFVVDDWRLASSISYDEAGRREFLPPSFSFDHDAYKILARHIATKKKRIRAINKAELSQLLTPDEQG